jgi:hypothetical protein
VIGKVYNIPPEPPVAQNTHRFPAGVVTFGVEYRVLDPESLRETYAPNAAHLAEMEALSPEGGFSDEGVSVHVCSSDDDFEYLRFDLFDGEPHYHYIHRADDGSVAVNNVIDFDVVAHGDMLPWAIGCLSDRLEDMLTEAGGAHLVANLDEDLVAGALAQVAERAAEARAAHRAARRHERSDT